jgi:hypothetical protein
VVAPARFKEYVIGIDVVTIEKYEKSFHDFVNRLHPASSPRLPGIANRPLMTHLS